MPKNWPVLLMLAGVVIAVVGFLMIDRYVPNFGIVENAMRADVTLLPASDVTKCIGSKLPGATGGGSACGLSVPYRTVLLLAVALFAVGAWGRWMRKRS